MTPHAFLLSSHNTPRSSGHTPIFQFLQHSFPEDDNSAIGDLLRMYGWFSGLMACGSCIGAVSWAARMIHLVNIFKANATTNNQAQRLWLFALAYRWNSAFLVTYAIEFLFLTSAKLMVLDRLSVFSAPEDAGMQKRWGLAGRVVMAAVVLGNAVGLAANAAAAVQYHKAAEAMGTASVYYAANNTKDGEIFRTNGRKQVELARSVASVQSFSEVVVLLLIIVAFAVVGVLCIRILRSRLKPIGVDAGYDAFMATVRRTLRLQMLGTTAVIFVTFSLRAVFSTMNAVSFQLQDFANNLCPGNKLCDACFNVYTHISQCTSG